MKEVNLKILIKLFKINFSISAFTFGGGYVVIPMMRKSFVEDMKLLSNDELLDIAAIAQSTPGAIAVNTSVLVGYNIAGIPGAIISSIGTILPPLLILSTISLFYKAFRDNKVISSILKGMEAGIAATIVDLLIDMIYGLSKEGNHLLKFLALFTFLVNYLFNINVIFTIIFCCLLCFTQSYIKNNIGGINVD